MSKEPTIELPPIELPGGGTISVDSIRVTGARVHNLQNIDVALPAKQMVVVTGVSGSGKSSLAFDTIYAEGQRRYLETFSSYVRQFMGNMERPDVDKIDGLSPVIAIDQKTTARNPRSTVGTVTEIYDFLRLLYARAGIAYSYKSGKPMEQLSDAEIERRVRQAFEGQKIAILAPHIKGRKGHYREDLAKIRKQGYTRARIDGEVVELEQGMQLDRYKIHDIEVVIDRLQVKDTQLARLSRSIETAIAYAKGSILIQNLDKPEAEPLWYCRDLMDPEHGISYDPPDPNSFSFNSPYGACPTCSGLGKIVEVDREAIVPEPHRSIAKGALAPLEERKFAKLLEDVKWAAKKENISLTKAYAELPAQEQEYILFGEEGIHVEEIDDYDRDSLFNYQKFLGLANYIKLRYRRSSANQVKQWAETYLKETTCPSCHGQRLKLESRHFFVGGKNISELAQMSLIRLRQWFEDLEEQLNDKQRTIAHELLKEIRQRIDFLLDVGLDYLALDRQARTLSGGEAQRIRLATQIGSQLQGVLYILDEPSIGLHQRDNHRLTESLENLRDLGNSIIVVEHDRDMMLAADYLVDIGPSAGIHGGKVVAQGTPKEVLKQNSLTAKYLSGERKIAVPEERRPVSDRWLTIKGATGHNLQNVTMELPLGVFVCVTGVSGSGKSSLINHTMHPVLHEHSFSFRKTSLPYESIEGLDEIDKVIEINQKPIGRTPRSNPATYTGLFTDIRNLFTQLPESQIRGYKPGRFSFNVKGGRCETCGGAGVQVIEMNFLPDVHVLCPTCRGKRYNRETLEVRYRGKSIFDVLEMNVEEALEFFEPLPRIRARLKTLFDVGLGYIKLGQPATTLSGGEAQRMKLATELSKKGTGRTVYILDEPTTGLHFQDIQYLIDVLNRLVEKGNTIVVIEHNLDVIKVADWLIDLGPEGGDKGGEIVATGTPETVAQESRSHTGRFLKEEL